MSLPVRDQAKYWTIAFLVFLLALWLIGDVILPFLLGGAIAYFLDPLADRLERAGLSRIAATLFIALIAGLIVTLGLLLVIPTLVRQLAQLVETAPQMAARLQGGLAARFPTLNEHGSVLNETLTSVAEGVRARGGELARSLLSSAMGLINVVILIVVVPVVAFYMLLDWDRMVARIDGWLPLDHRGTVRELARRIDQVLSGFVRGQVTVCLILGTFYSVALMLAGLNFGLVVGAIAGAVTFIPYVGAIFGGALAIGLALFQFWGDWMHVGIIAGIFALGQFLEGNIITPKLVGSSVGLHPLWLIFALSAFGTLFGFVGMLVAVPVAAVIGVIARFALTQYLESRLFKGQLGHLDEEALAVVGPRSAFQEAQPERLAAAQVAAIRAGQGLTGADPAPAPGAQTFAEGPAAPAARRGPAPDPDETLPETPGGPHGPEPRLAPDSPA